MGDYLPNLISSSGRFKRLKSLSKNPEQITIRPYLRLADRKTYGCRCHRLFSALVDWFRGLISEELQPIEAYSMQAPIELYGADTGNSLRAAVALGEAGIAFTPKPMDLGAGAHHRPEFLTLNPAGKVPTLVDHNYSPPLVINQSNAIIFYADAKAPGKLSPATQGVERFKIQDR